MKPSKLSVTLLQNYLLAISLMKNIAYRFTESEDIFQTAFTDQVKKIKEIENIMSSDHDSELGISFLIVQHQQEVIEVYKNYSAVLHETFSEEFINMLQMCFFVPFLHAATPKPGNIPKDENSNFLPDYEHIKSYLELKQKL